VGEANDLYSLIFWLFALKVLLVGWRLLPVELSI
jgi:hypothetical protein